MTRSSFLDNGGSYFFLTPAGIRTDLTCLLPEGFKTGGNNTPFLLGNGQILLSGILEFDEAKGYSPAATALLTPSTTESPNRCLTGSIRFHGCGASFRRFGTNFSTVGPITTPKSCNARIALRGNDGTPASGIPVSTRYGVYEREKTLETVTDENGVVKIKLPAQALCHHRDVRIKIGEEQSSTLEYNFTVDGAEKGCR